MPRRPKPDLEQIKALLDDRHDRYNRPDFITDDPISIPHRFSRRDDIEIAGLLTALLAWGRRDIILRNATELLRRMDDAPADFVREAGARELKSLHGFVHRTFNEVDATSMVRGIRQVMAHGGLEEAFALSSASKDTLEGILRFRSWMKSARGWNARTDKHLADPSAGSSAKRLNMYLRWMVRSDRRGVDFGLWKSLRPDQLVCPLDVHTGNVARALGLLRRSQNDWKAALELTSQLREMDPSDPVKYDFSLFGMGVNEDFSRK